MKTLFTTSPEEAAETIRAGGIVAFPTETVYGLGANIFDEAAIEKIFRAKDRPSDNPLIAHIFDASQIELVSDSVSIYARKLIEAFFPGPLTLVLPKADAVPQIATAGLKTVGVRMPDHSIATAFLRACNSPVTAPSANLSGRPSPTTWQAVAEDLDGRIDCILKGEPTAIGLESTVVDCSEGSPMILRQGAISYDEILRVVGSLRISNPAVDRIAKSPGMRHRHYSPNATVKIWERGTYIAEAGDSAFIGMHPPVVELAARLVVPDISAYARSLFEFFRDCDRCGISTIYCEEVVDDGIGAAPDGSNTASRSRMTRRFASDHYR